MRTRGRLFLLVLLISMLAPVFSVAAVPRTINYQGYLKDSGGVPQNGTFSMTFSLYGSSSGGSELWTETHSSVAVTNGLYRVAIGSVDPGGNPLSLPFDGPYYLGISIGADPEMTPRQALTSAPFALRAAVSDSVPSGMVTADKIAAGAVTPEKLANVCSKGDFLVMTPSGWGCFSTSCVPSAEVCDRIDNNCNGQIDEGFKNQVSGKYEQNTACGNCYTDCTTIFAKPNAYGSCDSSGAPVCVMNCNAGYFNLNGIPNDGCEFQVDATAIYVSGSNGTNDTSCGNGPAATGSGRHPCATITYGMSQAVSLGRQKVLVADGIYNESVSIINGISLYGGYHADTWERHLSTTLTIIRGVSTVSNHDRTIIASAITLATTVEGFRIEGSTNAKTAGNSYAIYVSGGSSNLRFQNNYIQAGNGGPAADAPAAANGMLGVDGTGRTVANAAQYDAFQITAGTGVCNASNNRQYANGGLLSCGSDNVSGGAGGGNSCPATAFAESSGKDGFVGQAGDGTLGGAAGTFGDAGDDGEYSSTICTLPGASMSGTSGTNGQKGLNGASGAGCSAATGSTISGHWVGSTAAFGADGGNGGGGGGGGAGGGGDCTMAGCTKDRLGGHGGGGGSGGCGGIGGAGGSSGGGSFGFFIVGGSAPVITGNTILRGIGGKGGDGGAAGYGGVGGLGGAGGTCPGNCFCYREAGKGGDGGAGGGGGGGGGGCGAPSYAIYTSGVGTPNYCTSAGNIISGGAGGQAGAGGLSYGNPGVSGVAGPLGDCSFN